MGLVEAIGGVFLGCWLNAIFLELLVRIDPACGNLVTFSQFVLISLNGFIFTSNFGQRKRQIPIRSYMAVVLMFFSTNVLNNVAFNFNISMPLHMIFRSASLISNMIMGIVILKKRYPFSKYLSVALITIGVIICTLESSQEFAKDAVDEPDSEYSGLFWWCLGILILIVSLLISALLGIYQELLFAKYGKHPFEALFYTHLLPIPFFFMMFENIKDHFNIALTSEPIAVPFFSFQVPVLIVYLLGNISTQYLCISSVYRLSSETSSFTLSLVITLRKFISLLFSIVYFQNNFTPVHWVGTAMVFFGTAIFTELPQKLLAKDNLAISKGKKKKA